MTAKKSDSKKEKPRYPIVNEHSFGHGWTKDKDAKEVEGKAVVDATNKKTQEGKTDG